MADNVTVTPGVGATVAADEIAGVKFQRIKIGLGPDGTANDLEASTGDGKAGTAVLAAGVMGYNGATLDRIRGDVANGLDVDVTRVQGTVTVDSELPAANALDDGAANPTTPIVGAALLGYNGATLDRLRGDVANGLDVDVTRVQGTVAVDSELPTAILLDDGLSGAITTPVVGAVELAFNGTTYDRVPGDSANGLDVDVTRVQGTVSVNSELAAADDLADSEPNPNTTTVGAASSRFNETTWDRERGNTEGILFASAARTATVISPDQVNYNARGVQVQLRATALGTGNIKLQIMGKDPVGGQGYIILEGPTITTIGGTYCYEVYPGASSGAIQQVFARVSGSLPRTWLVSVLHSDSSSWTYSVGYSLIV